MKTLPLTVVITLAAVLGRIQTSDLPHPRLSLDRSAKVLRLVCQPPPEAHESDSSWRDINEIKLLALLPQYTSSANVSLVNMSSILEEPQTNSMFISQASFLSPGTWVSKCVSLKFELPVTVRELGQYFCVVGYWDKKDDLQWFSVQVDVNKDFVFSPVKTAPKKEQNFEVSVVDAHKVHVTWTNPQQSRFEKARVSRKLAGDDGESIPMSLFTTNGKADITSGSQVLLKNFNLQDGHSNNMSITLYVKSDPHGLHYRYSCWVPYPACKGQDRLGCSCCQQSNDLDRQKCALQTPQDSENYQIHFYVLLSISVPIFLFFSFCMVVFALFKCNKCKNKAWLKKIFKPKRTSTRQTHQYSELPLGDETGHNPGNGRNVDTPNPGNGQDVDTPNPGNGRNVDTPNPGNGRNVDTPNPGNGRNVDTPNPGNGRNVDTPNSGNGRNVDTPNPGNGRNVDTPNPGNGRNVDTPNPGNGRNVDTPNPGNGRNVDTPNPGNGRNVDTPNSGNGRNVDTPNPGNGRDVDTNPGNVQDVEAGPPRSGNGNRYNIKVDMLPPASDVSSSDNMGRSLLLPAEDAGVRPCDYYDSKGMHPEDDTQ